MTPLGLSLRMFLVAGLALAPRAATAQVLGTFQWQLEPYCNVLSLTITQLPGGIFTLDGMDDQCGAGPAAVTGEAFVAGAQASLGFSIVTAPGGGPVHANAIVGLATLNGTWQDSAGHAGAFRFTPGAGSGGGPRPPAMVGDITSVSAGAGLTGGGVAGDLTLAVNPADVQLRVTGACPSGQAMQGVNQNGSVACAVLAGGGDVTAVLAGSGLSGGGPSGDVTLGVLFGGSGTTELVARADHTHEGATTRSVRLGQDALSNEPGEFSTYNVAIGHAALRSMTGGVHNTAIGTEALASAGAGSNNTAIGMWALAEHSGGHGNVAVGSGAQSEGSGDFNTSIGVGSLLNASGAWNIALGWGAGRNLTIGANNMYLGNPGAPAENATIRVGEPGLHQRTFLAGVRAVTPALNDALPVVIDSQGQLGTGSGLGASAIDPTEIQRRVTGTCPAGQAIQAIGQAGDVTCGAAAATTAIFRSAYSAASVNGNNITAPFGCMVLDEAGFARIGLDLAVPDGAAVTGLRVKYVDGSAATSARMYIMQVNLPTPSEEPVGPLFTTQDGTHVQDLSLQLEPPTATRSYYLVFDTPAAHSGALWFCGATVFYTLP